MDQAALDVAIEMGIPHGGWVPKGRKTENGRLADKYNVRETNAIDYNQRTELNVIDSEAPLLFSSGEYGFILLPAALASCQSK